MVDFVVAVADPAAWHEENMALNPGHYAGVGCLGSTVAAAVQETYGAGVYYNTMVPLPAAARGAPGQLMKYGVISLHALVDDLLHWRSMYISGRMHKPVRLIVFAAPWCCHHTTTTQPTNQPTGGAG